jgi:hypothetical protein
VTPATTTSPSEEDVQRLHRRLDEVLGKDHAATLMACLGDWSEVTPEAFRAMHRRLREVLGVGAGDELVARLWHIPFPREAPPD